MNNHFMDPFRYTAECIRSGNIEGIKLIFENNMFSLCDIFSLVGIARECARKDIIDLLWELDGNSDRIKNETQS